MKLLQTFIDTMIKNIAITEYTFHKSISVGHNYQNKFDQSVGYGLILAVSEEMYKSESMVRYITNTVSREIKENGSIKDTVLNLCNTAKDTVSIKKGEDPEIKKPFNFISSNARHKNFVICGFKTDFCFLDGEIFSMNDLVSVYATIDSLLMGISIQTIVENKVCRDVQLVIKNKDATTEHINECKIVLLNGKTFECVSENFSDFFSVNIKEIKGKMMLLASKVDVKGKWLGQVGVAESHSNGVHIISETNEKRVIYKLKARMALLSSSNKVTKISDMEYIVE